MYNYLIKTFLYTFYKKIKEFKQEKKGFFWMGLILFIIFELNIFGFFYLLFNYLINNVESGYLFAPKILAIIIMIIFYVILFLSFISTIPTIYKNKEVPFLLTNPVKYIDIFKYGVFKVIFYASFGSLFILLPALIAFSIANGYGLFYYFIVFFSIFGITISASFLGILLFLLFSKFVLSLKPFFKYIVFISLLLFIGYLLVFLLPSFVIKPHDTGFSLFETYIFSYSYDNLLLPYNWFVKLLKYTGNGYYLAIFSYIFFIIFSIFILGFLLFVLGKYFYFESIENLNNFYIFKRKNKLKLNSIFTKNKYINLIIKDILVHIKDPVQWTQLLIFGILLIIYVLIIKGSSIRNIQTTNLATILTIGNLGVIGFFLSAISLRFIFPNISLEGKSFWVLKTIPIKINIFYILKILFFLIFLMFVGYILTYFYVNIIGIQYNIRYFLYLLLFPIILIIVSIFFSMGSIYPDFKETNPSKISTSFSGLLSVFIGNAIVIILIFILYPKIYYYYNNLLDCVHLGFSYFLKELIIIYILFFILISFFIYLGYKKFKNIEY